MARYVFDGDNWRDPKTGDRMPLPEREGLCVPMVTPVMPEYTSPIDGKTISTRHERREDLKRSGSVEYEPSLSPTKGKFKNPHFSKKWGIPVSDDFR